MVDLETKNRLLKELEKTGNVYISCARAGIDRSTYYEWLKSDKTFGKKIKEAIKRGRENNCDIAEHALMLKVKDKDLGAIKYQLGHNSPRYKPKARKVTIEHSTTGEKMEKFKEMEREHWNQISDAHRDLLGYVRHLDDDYEEEDIIDEKLVEKVENMFPDMPKEFKNNIPEEKESDQNVQEETENPIDQNLPTSKNIGKPNSEAVNKIILELPGDDGG